MHNTTVQKIQFRLTWHWFFRKCIKSECSFFFPGLWLAVGDADDWLHGDCVAVFQAQYEMGEEDKEYVCVKC